MPILGITGNPGAGKTLNLMQDLLEESAKSPEQGRRFLVACGIEGLDPTLVDRVMASAKDWNAVDFAEQGTCDCHDGIGQVLDREGIPRQVKEGARLIENPEWAAQMALGRPHAHTIPNGAKIYVDEAWKDFGHLHENRGAPTPPHVLALAEHRHRGIDFVMTTQMPNQLFPFMRGLVGPHRHVVRHAGSKLCTVYEWGELCEDTKSPTQRERAVASKWVQPSKLFGSYKSAAEHTIKTKIPWRVVLIPLCCIGAVLALWLGYVSLKGYGKDRESQITATKDDGGEADTASDAGRGNKKDKPLTPAEWVERITPRFAGVHGSQPIFDNREALAVPRTYCVMRQELDYEACTCYTEQATKITGILYAACKAMALEGQYDPFRAPFEEGRAVQFEPAPLPEQGSTLGESFDKPLTIPGAVVLP